MIHLQATQTKDGYTVNFLADPSIGTWKGETIQEALTAFERWYTKTYSMSPIYKWS